MQIKDAYNYITYKFMQKIEYQRNKLKIPRIYGIENYKEIQKVYKNENNGHTIIDTSSVENIPNSNMNQGENKDSVKYNKSKKYSDWSDKTLRTYKDKEEIEDKTRILIAFKNETKIDVETSLEVQIKCGIISAELEIEQGPLRILKSIKLLKNQNNDTIKCWLKR